MYVVNERYLYVYVNWNLHYHVRQGFLLNSSPFWSTVPSSKVQAPVHSSTLTQASATTSSTVPLGHPHPCRHCLTHTGLGLVQVASQGAPVLTPS